MAYFKHNTFSWLLITGGIYHKQIEWYDGSLDSNLVKFQLRSKDLDSRTLKVIVDIQSSPTSRGVEQRRVQPLAY